MGRDNEPRVRRSQLDNGIRVVTEEMSGIPSVTIGLWVENGSRHERPEQAGISHFLEHLFFKGTERRSAAQIAEEADSVGAVLNAFTGKEHTCYYAKVLREHLPLVQDLLSDIFLRSVFAPEEIERERSVVLQEILQVEDTPDDYVHDLFALRYWPGHPLSFPVCGTVETVSRFRQEDFREFVDARYRPNSIVVAAAGDVNHEEIVGWVACDFDQLRGEATSTNGAPPKPSCGVHYVEKPLEQVHLCLGTPGISQTARERYAGYLLNTALGGGMSSRLFQEIRERRGRAYSVYSFLSSYSDAGYLGIYVGTSPEWVAEVVDIIVSELEKLQREGLTPEELRRVKNQLKGNLLLGLETSDNRMTRIAKNELYFGRHVPASELVAAIDSTTNDEIVSLAQRLFDPSAMAVALLGDMRGHPLPVLAGCS
ncbi:MAG: insulinase family protein [Candidatus Binatia bacterium]|nr:insulinase family protein [Candidatus Binatia bacterium]